MTRIQAQLFTISFFFSSSIAQCHNVLIISLKQLSFLDYLDQHVENSGGKENQFR